MVGGTTGIRGSLYYVNALRLQSKLVIIIIIKYDVLILINYIEAQSVVVYTLMYFQNDHARLIKLQL